MIIQELSNNVDAYWKSMHLTKQRDASGGLVYMGPIWDLDLAFANYNYAPEGLCGNTTWRMNTTNWGVAFQPLWEIWRMRPFRPGDSRSLERPAKRRDHLAQPLRDQDRRVPRPHRKRAHARQHGLDTPSNNSTSVECQNFPTYAEYLTHLKTWIRGRIDWMDARIAESAFVNP